jgi:hypothetical protein
VRKGQVKSSSPQSLSGVLGFCLQGLGAVIFAQGFAASPARAEGISDTVEAYFKRRDQLDITYREFRTEIKTDLRSSMRKHYEGIKQTYLMDPFLDSVRDADSRLTTAKNQRNLILPAVTAAKTAFNGLEPAATNFSTCLNSQDSSLKILERFSSRKDTVTFARIGTSLQAGEPLSDEQETFLSNISSAQTLTEDNLVETFQYCCEASKISAQTVDCARLATDAKDNLSPLLTSIASIKIAPSTYPPNPLQDSSLRPSMVAELLKEHGGEIRRIRNESGVSLQVKAENEEDIFARLEADCKKSQEKKQEKTHPLADGVLNPILKALKCSILPTVATLYADTSIQKLTLAVGGAQIEDRSKGWDLNCDPLSMQAFDSMRPTDPNVVANQWGLPQLANPPWLQNLRTLPMLGSPFSVTPIPGGGYMTPYGAIAQPDVGSESNIRSTAGSAGSQARKDRAANFRDKNRARSRSRTSSRRLAQSVQATSAIRGLSDNISRGRSVDESLSSLRSGTSATRNLASKIVTKNKTRGLSNVAKDRSQRAGQMKSTVRNLSGSRASRTTSESILGSLRGRGRTATPTGPTVSDLRRQTEAERRRLEKLTENYVSNIELARRKAEEVRVNILKKIAEHDLATTNVLSKLADKPPRKQAKIMMDLRTTLNVISREIAEFKSQYDVLQASVLEQAMLLKNLASFGTKSPNFPGFGGQNDPNKMPRGYPTVGGGGTSRGGGRGSVVPGSASHQTEPRSPIWDFIEKALNPKFAWALAEEKVGYWGIFQNEKDWSLAWQKHTQDFENYVKIRVEEENAYRQQAAKIVEDRYNEVSLDNPPDDDVETLVTMYDFSEMTAKESRSLITDAEARKNSLTGNNIALLRKIESESQESMESIETIFMQSKETYSKDPEENPTPYEELILSYLVE